MHEADMAAQPHLFVAQEEDAVVVGVTVKDDAGGPPELIFTRVAGGASKAGAQALDVAVAAAQASWDLRRGVCLPHCMHIVYMGALESYL
jgi:hypothetical protein